MFNAASVSESPETANEIWVLGYLIMSIRENEAPSYRSAQSDLAVRLPYVYI